MFGLGFTEILVIIVIIIVVMKPEDLPGLFKKVGKGYGDVKKTVNEVKQLKDDFVSLADVDLDKLAKETKRLKADESRVH